MLAMAGRAGIDLKLERFDELARKVPVLANIRPAGDKYLMEDFYYAGGLRAMLNALGDLLNLECQTVNGKTIGENIAGAKDLQRRRDPPALPIRCRPPVDWRCCAAISRPMAR